MDTVTYYRIKGMSPQLPVADIERSIAFYTKSLDFAVDFRYEDFYSGISKDGYSIHLKQSKPSAKEGKTERNNDNLDIVFSVDRIEDVYEKFLSRAVEIAQPLRDMPYGKEFYVQDPDGNIIAFVE